MEIDIHKLKQTLQSIFGECNEYKRLCKLFEPVDTNGILDFLGEKLLEKEFTEEIGKKLFDILPLIVTKKFKSSQCDDNLHQRICVALAKLIRFSPEMQRFSMIYFEQNPSPFTTMNAIPKRKTAKLSNTNHLSRYDMVECCYTFINFKPNFFRRAWKWSEFIEIYCKGEDYERKDMYTLLSNHILATLANMTPIQLEQLNEMIPLNVRTMFEINKKQYVNDVAFKYESHLTSEGESMWSFDNSLIKCVEGVMLPIFNNENSSKTVLNGSNNDHDLVMVKSTRLNLRCLSIGVASGKAVCLSGPVGCGKTSLVEYLATKTGRMAPEYAINENKAKVIKNCEHDSHSREVKKVKMNKRKAESIASQICPESAASATVKSHSCGFLRIQLGEQTDSKVLLGQYRCTDVPGEFVWQAGVLTQAVINGYWLLLEDLDLCTQDVCMVLMNLLESGYLSVPGFRDRIQISSGFQLFITLRTHSSQKSNTYIDILTKYLYTINIVALTRNELCQIITEKYPKLTTIANRIVDVYLMFSKGCHSIDKEENNDSEMAEPSTMTTRPNKGSDRLISTRDLLKLCNRSSPKFSITSEECAFFVFQNAVDLFCSHFISGDTRKEFIVNIGAKLGIIASRCEYLSNEYKPNISNGNGNLIGVGRVEMKRRVNDISSDDSAMKRLSSEALEIVDNRKRRRIDNEKQLNVPSQMRKKVPNFSFTRLASCLLERIAVAIDENEPVLLVGETGVGKTSTVQYLAYQTNHKLVVVNMNNTSDASDLIGGFKPVDMMYVIAPLRAEFEYLFGQSFNAAKNEKFLRNISVCFNQGEFQVLIRLMLAIAEKVLVTSHKPKDDSNSQKNERIISRWSSLKIKLSKLNTQLKHSVGISFAFINGPLIQCIKNGDWVLLDEINLASTETLECLSTILEANGSIVLLEKGEFVPVTRHPDFRIFACMNPSTDIGKKDLATGIRNRFTEFFVDELTSECDLLILVGDYLRNSGIQATKVEAVVKFYQKIRSMAKLDLSDGLGNQPVFSLRTLCRALSICSQNKCGSIERNLYESFCLSFLTQLDTISHSVVLNLIQKSLLSNTKAVLSQKIPQPTEDSIEFQGYWIEKGPKDVQLCEDYILTENVIGNLKNLARIISIGRLPVLLQGPTSAGKTSLIDYVAKRSGNHCLRINNHEHTDLQEYIGTYTVDVAGTLKFKEGVLVQAMRNGYWIILDELNLAPSDILEALNRVLDDNREIFITETQELIKAHPNFMLFATQNPPGIYGGRKTLSRAFKNRFIELHFSEIPESELEIILEKRCRIPKSYSQKMVKTMSELQVNRHSTAKSSFTLRDLFRWGNRYTHASDDLMKDNLYDWGQHLIDEGYLVLSSKIRNEIEIHFIIDAMFRNFRKKIIPENIFHLHANTSLVTKALLQDLLNHPNSKNINWTLNIRQMAILAGKAIQFNEPVLLVGSTGCGKTTICQILADIATKNLRILNCHMHTEGADFLGGLRPFRGEQCAGEARRLFEWSDGPLIEAMIEGSFFLADEISLAEDSVLERLNCVLEPERTILLAEKGGCNDVIDIDSLQNQTDKLIVRATNGFQFLATMNPGGDFGKKELSPALRNRFTEIWCRSVNDENDLISIALHSIEKEVKFQHNADDKDLFKNIATIIAKAVLFMSTNIRKFNYSVRDILAWVNYIIINSDINQQQRSAHMPLHEAILIGLETLFLDALEMLPYSEYKEIETMRLAVFNYVNKEINSHLKSTLNLENFNQKKLAGVVDTENEFGVQPFLLTVSINRLKADTFKFTAPTTRENLFRLLSAMSLPKAILLEGPPGVGKTSLIENLAAVIGYNIVRINFCEHTDLTDLFGADQPSDAISDEKENQIDNNTGVGSFVWRDGPLLAALKSPNTWILLDELNLAPQSVLEGLNAILDHRGEVFIPELNKTFKLDKQTRIFASQNPFMQGGGRKGLPQSFLNRFTKVYLRKLHSDDLCHIINKNYELFFEKLKAFLLPKQPVTNETSTDYFESFNSATRFDCCIRMVQFSQILDNGINNLEFGYRGGPFEANLRDILKWCDMLCNDITGLILNDNHNNDDKRRYEYFMSTLYNKMKLVYCHRMRTDSDKEYIRSAFATTFSCNVDSLEKLSNDIVCFWNDDHLYLNDLKIVKEPIYQSSANTKKPLLLDSQRELLKSLGECMILKAPTILCGPSDSGKTKLIDTLCCVLNRSYEIETIDDTITGSFQQVDLNRQLEEISQKAEILLVQYCQNIILNHEMNSDTIQLISSWEQFIGTESCNDNGVESSMSQELFIFKKRINSLIYALKSLQKLINTSDIEALIQKTVSLQSMIHIRESLNTGGHFEWVDSKIVKALKNGQFICLDHVNLCSPATLDRLNSVFETNGKLLLSEKGASCGNESECVTKHEQFRAFLTLDPKNGEISRAMRNRCIELSFTKDSFTNDDLKAVIFEIGITDTPLIEWILRIHTKMCQSSEFNAFNVTHLCKVAFLTIENLRLGSDKQCAIRNGASEVYVRSSYTDLLGYGLEYYWNKLQNIIDDELTKVPDEFLGLINFGNTIIRANELNKLSLIRLQCEPMLLTIKVLANQLSQQQTINVFRMVRDKYSDIDINNLTPKTTTYLLYMLYELCSIDDIDFRRNYVHQSLELITSLDKNLIESLKQLNENLASIMRGADINVITSIPWNSSMIRCLRDYHTISLPTADQIKLSAILLAEIIFKPIEVNDKVKRNSIDVITYSKAVNQKLISNVLDNDFLTYLHPFLQNIKSMVIRSVQSASEFNYEQYSDLICSMLWANRLYAISKHQLFSGNSVNRQVIDELTLHFNWLMKYLMNSNAMTYLESVFASIEHNKHHQEVLKNICVHVSKQQRPLNQVRKKFVKKLTHFAPFYEVDQIQLYQKVGELTKCMRLLSSGKWEKINNIDGNGLDLMKKLRILMSDEYYEYKNSLLNHMNEELIQWLPEYTDVIVQFAINKQLPIHNCGVTKNASGIPLSMVELNAKTKGFFDFCSSIEENQRPTKSTAISIILSGLPIMEYYALKALNPIHRQISHKFNLNNEFFANIQTIDVNMLKLVQTISTDEYKNCEVIWGWILSKMENASNIYVIFDQLSCEFYRKFSSFMRTLNTTLIQFHENSIAYSSRAINDVINKNDITSGKISANEPIFTTLALDALFDCSGNLKSAGLGELDLWQKSLQSHSKIVWNNIDMVQNEFGYELSLIEHSLRYGRKLLIDVGYIETLVQDSSNISDFRNEFGEIIEYLKSTIESVSSVSKHNQQRSTLFYQSALIRCLSSILELQLLTFMPIVDPVEKNKLKKSYIEEDQLHLTNLLSAYDFMKIIMSYEGLGGDMVDCIKAKNQSLHKSLDKYSKKCAIRPMKNNYSDLIDQVNFFLQNSFRSKPLVQLIIDIEHAMKILNGDQHVSEKDLQYSNEIMNRINLSISTAESFQQSTIRQFSSYYRDFTMPLECSITAMKHGLQCMKECLIKRQHLHNKEIFRNPVHYNDEEISIVISDLVKFPNVNKTSIFGDNQPKSSSISLLRLLKNIGSSESVHLSIIKSTLYDVSDSLNISNSICTNQFNEFENALHAFNAIWKREEDTKRKAASEKDSLYTNRTHCVNENEEEQTNKEIQMMFPNYADTDFGDFTNSATLEKESLTGIPLKSETEQIITDNDLKFIANTFNRVLFYNSRFTYYKPSKMEFDSSDHQKCLIESFKLKSNVFYQLVQKYNHSLSSHVDDSFYSSVGFIIGIIQDTLQSTESKMDGQAHYDFYKDSNIPEVQPTIELLNRLDERVLNELQQWPDHPVLIDILVIVDRIRSLPSDSPIARFNVGFQLLRQKVDEWNGVAHKLNNLRDIEIEIAGFIQRWMKQELGCWRKCLTVTFENVQSKAYRYWPFMFNLLQEYLGNSGASLGCDLTDFKSVEKCFNNEETTINNEYNNSKITTVDLISVLKQYIESSNYAEFSIRMKILKAFEFYLHHSNVGNVKKRQKLIAIIHNLHQYYCQFEEEIVETIKTKRTVVEKKVKDFVKIESYNKDLSYFGMKNNIARVQRYLHKFSKEYEKELMLKIASMFVWRSESLNTNQKNEAKPAYYSVDIDSFLVAKSLSNQYSNLSKHQQTIEKSENTNLISKIEKLFKTSRNIVKQIIHDVDFPDLLYNLDRKIAEQIDTCNYLRGLEIDRSKEKPKQKSQAKHILTQKRKALSDGFKMLTALGLSFRAGSLQASLRTDLIDLNIAPFSMQLLIDGKKTEKMYANIPSLSTMDSRYAKCVFKLKLLQRSVLAPHTDLGLIHLERIKGFSFDLFLLAQTQRHTLSNTMNELQQLKEHIESIKQIHNSITSNNVELDFNKLLNDFKRIEKASWKILQVIKQYDQLFKYVPEEEDNQFTVIISKDLPAFTKSSAKYKDIRLTLGNVENRIKNLLDIIDSKRDTIFHTSATINNIKNEYARILADISVICDGNKLNDMGELAIFLQPLQNLLIILNTETSIESNDELVASSGDDNHSHSNITNELENIIHGVLISIQNIYKKHSREMEIDAAITEANGDDGNASDAEFVSVELKQNHLKEKLSNEIAANLKSFGLSNILSKISKILNFIRYGKRSVNDEEYRLDYLHRLVSIVPILKQLENLYTYFMLQQISTHHLSLKTLSAMLTVFIELSTKGFCIPPDLMQDEDDEKNEGESSKGDGGLGLEDGTGENDISDKIESEDQLDTAKKPEDNNNKDQDENDDCKEENGIDMSEDFDSKLQDLDKESNSDQSDNDEEEELDKQMGETEEGTNELDEQIWSSDDEKDSEDEEPELDDAQNNKGSNEENEVHNEANSHNENGENGENEGLDAAEPQQENKERKNDIDKIDEQETGEEHANPHHNEMEEPPEPEDIDLNNINLDNNEDNNEKEERNEENPFDIDTMKDNMQANEDENGEEDDENGKQDDETQKGDNDNESSSDDSDVEMEQDLEQDLEQDQSKPEEPVEEEQPNEENNPESIPNTDEIDKEQTENEKKKEESENYLESQDKQSKEDNIQAMPDIEKGSKDQVQENSESTPEQENDMDAQDTGEDQNGIGQAENDESKSGHQGASKAKEKNDPTDAEKDTSKSDARKRGDMKEDRTISNIENEQRLKTAENIDNTKEDKQIDENNSENKSDEYQHIKDANNQDETVTMDNATEEQSEQLRNAPIEKEIDENEEEGLKDELMEDDAKPDETNDPIEKIDSEKIESGKSKPKGQKSKEQMEQCNDIDDTDTGELVSTYTVQRMDETIAHCSMNVIQDSSLADELSNTEVFQLRKLVESELMSSKSCQVEKEDFELWQDINNKMLPNARELCEQLRLILEPTKCTRLKGDYRTGRRINMKKIIPYIASQFRKDKIWLRRTKPAQRDYKITIAIDDSKSMHYNNTKELTLQAISLVSQALTLLESGCLSILGFGERPKIILNHSEQFDGSTLVHSLNFEENQSRIAELLDFVRFASEQNQSASDNGIFENLLIILSDGRNIFSEGEKKVRNSIKSARQQKIFIIYIIVDNPENKHSILDIRVPHFTLDRKTITMRPYLDTFPFPYYIIVKNLAQLPSVLSDAMRQWFEMVSSEF